MCRNGSMLQKSKPQKPCPTTDWARLLCRRNLPLLTRKNTTIHFFLFLPFTFLSLWDNISGSRNIVKCVWNTAQAQTDISKEYTLFMRVGQSVDENRWVAQCISQYSPQILQKKCHQPFTFLTFWDMLNRKTFRGHNIHPQNNSPLQWTSSITSSLLALLFGEMQSTTQSLHAVAGFSSSAFACA